MKWTHSLTAAAISFVSINSAFAQNSVKLYGLVNVGIGSYQQAGASRIKAVNSGDMSTSFWGVSGTEDLGSGLKAQFALESFVGMDTGAAGRFSGDAMFAKNAYVGLGGGFGQLRLGRNTSQMFVSLLLFNSFGDSFGFSPTLLHYYLDARDIPISKTARLQNDTAWRNSLTYISPVMSGLRVNLQGALGEGVGKSSFAATMQYFGDPFSATVAYQTVGTDAAAPTNGNREKTFNLGAAYDFRVVKVYAQYGQIDDESYGSKLRLYDISAEVPVNGSGKILAAYGYSKVRTGTFAGIIPLISGNTHKTVSLGYDHSLSKRTDVYAVYMNDKIDGLRNGNSVAVGMRHSF
ncbi:MAG TPA: porin [Burkholderiaceae bacterium]|nr:porin [Burkholderiaceae bacterium]